MGPVDGKTFLSETAQKSKSVNEQRVCVRVQQHWQMARASSKSEQCTLGKASRINQEGEGTRQSKPCFLKRHKARPRKECCCSDRAVQWDVCPRAVLRAAPEVHVGRAGFSISLYYQKKQSTPLSVLAGLGGACTHVCFAGAQRRAREQRPQGVMEHAAHAGPGRAGRADGSVAVAGRAPPCADETQLGSATSSLGREESRRARASYKQSDQHTQDVVSSYRRPVINFTFISRGFTSLFCFPFGK